MNFRKIYPAPEFYIMRDKKLNELYNFIKTHDRLCILKAPSGSGKSFLANLFRYYLINVKNLKKSHIFYLIYIPQIKTYKQWIEYFKEQTNLDFASLKDIKEGEYYFIIDEAHGLYSPVFKKFWIIVKHCSEQVIAINFLFCAIFSYTRADSDVKSPFILANRFQSFEFLRFTELEFSELIDAYKKYDVESIFCPINQKRKEILYGLFQGHPELSYSAIKFLKIEWKQDQEKYSQFNDDQFKKELYSKDFLFRKLIVSSKANPLKYEFTMKQISLLKKMHIFGGIHLDQSDENYDDAKKLERKGYFYENSKTNIFQFSIPLIGSIIYSFLENRKSDPIENIAHKTKVELALETLRRMRKKNLLNSKQFKNKKQKNLAEDQWVNEFYAAFTTILPDNEKHFILSQGSSEINPEFLGEIDLYVNDYINKGIEIIREGHDVMEHLLRKYRTLFSKLFENVKFEKDSVYKFSNNGEYLIIDFRSKKFNKLKKYIKDVNGKKINIANLHMEDDLMRVVYDDNEINYFDVYYQEIFLERIYIID